jgi:shikimate kinase
MRHPRDNIAFIGARGAGKSKLSRKLGKLSGRVVLSTDTLISYEAQGRRISDIVSAEGWIGFRNREYDLLRKLSAMTGVVIDCGGGILVEADTGGGETFSERKCNLLKEMATVVYIRRDMDWLLSRGAADAVRPKLADDYAATLRRRLPWYERAADLTLDMTGLEIDAALERLQRELSL